MFLLSNSLTTSKFNFFFDYMNKYKINYIMTNKTHFISVKHNENFNMSHNEYMNLTYKTFNIFSILENEFITFLIDNFKIDTETNISLDNHLFFSEITSKYLNILHSFIEYTKREIDYFEDLLFKNKLISHIFINNGLTIHERTILEVSKIQIPNIFILSNFNKKYSFIEQRYTPFAEDSDIKLFNISSQYTLNNIHSNNITNVTYFHKKINNHFILLYINDINPSNFVILKKLLILSLQKEQYIYIYSDNINILSFIKKYFLEEELKYIKIIKDDKNTLNKYLLNSQINIFLNIEPSLNSLKLGRKSYYLKELYISNFIFSNVLDIFNLDKLFDTEINTKLNIIEDLSFLMFYTKLTTQHLFLNNNNSFKKISSYIEFNDSYIFYITNKYFKIYRKIRKKTLNILFN